MTRSREATLIGLAFFFAACSSSTPSGQNAGQGGSSAVTAHTAGTSASNTAGTGTSSGNTAGSSPVGNSAGTGSGDVAGSGNTSGGSTGTNGSGGSGNSTPTAGTSAGGSASAGMSGQAGGSSAAGGGSVIVTLPDVVTSSDGAFWKTGTLTPATSGTADVTADDTALKQRWDGFGGTFNEAGWDALSVLSAADKALAISLLFDAANGANFAYGRLPIGASDYALARYTLDDTANDYTMASFSIAQDKKLLIPYIKAAVAVKPGIHLWASPWTPPGWMKDNNSTDDGKMKDDDKTLNAFALYLEKFVQAYAGEGLKIEAVHPQNEPGYVNPYPSCSWTGALYIKFIRDYLGPLFEKDKVPAEIWCGTMSAPGDGTIATDLANDAKAMAYVKGFGLQWNTKGTISSLKSKNVPIMQTEHKCGNYNFATDYWSQSSYDANKPQNDYAYGIESWKNIKDWIVAGVNSYSAWNMVLDTSGANLNASKPWHQDALLTVDRSAKKLTATPAYYVFRHLSQFVTPKATVIGTSGGDALAFKNPDGTLVVVMYNSGAAKKATVSLGGTKFQFDMPGNGWATVHHAK
ncbi:MAG TPA: glycoside hydrolase family 30 beta sandwich domain-containing protein [Polyangiaceae bacterium]|nr:glycoside hydrolase family 30 beta sandwich domain-containing protein [Polyangiaceae bacterium]